MDPALKQLDSVRTLPFHVIDKSVHCATGVGLDQTSDMQPSNPT